MKKLFTFLIILFLWAGSSWGQSVIIGTGITTTNGSVIDPVERYYNYEHYQIIYTAAELIAAGLPSGAVINALGFSISESAVSLANYEISMGLTAQAIAQPYISTLTPVKNAFTYAPIVQVAGSFDMIPFDATFTWDGTSNIVVNTCTGSNPFTTPYGGLRYTAGTSGVITAARTDGTSCCATTTLTSSTLKPNIQFNYTGGTGCSGIPAPGNTVSSANPACPGVNFTLSLQNSTPGSGVTYQWETSPDGLAPWTPVGTSSPFYTASQTTTTWYRCQVTCTGNTGTSPPLEVTMNPFLNCYCSSMPSNTADEEIYSVTVNGATNAYNCTTVAPGPGSILNRYSNFFPLGSLTTIQQGALVSFTILEDECDGATYFSNGCAIWIDCNHDGDFLDADEKVFVETTTTVSPRTIAGTFTVPLSATLGETAMRITVAEGYSGTGLTPCLSYGYGETEDYLLTIEPAQLGTLQGYVYDLQGGCTTALKFATVSNGPFSTITDGAGFYQFLDMPIGTYNFTASLDGYIDTTKTVSVTLGGITNQDFCLRPDLVPPTGLSVILTGYNAHVSWMAPGSMPDQWIKWDDGTFSSSIGLTSGGTFSVASRWPVADITPYAGMYLKKIRFYSNDLAATFTLKVWKGVDAATPLHSQAVTAVLGWNEITLTPSVLIDGTQEFWFGYETTHAAGTFPAGCDDGPNIEGYGNMIYNGGAWYTLYALAPTLPYNWLIHGWVTASSMSPEPLMPMVQQVTPPAQVDNAGTVASLSQANVVQTPSNRMPAGQTAPDITTQPSPRAPMAPSATFTGYNVYKNTVKIANNILDTFYDDNGLPPGGYDYEVSAQYEYGESVKIGPAHVDVFSCFVPTDVQIPIATTTTNQAKATWTPSTITPNPEWIVEYGLTGFAHGAGIDVQHVSTTPEFTMNSLTPGAAYDFYVRTFCAAGDSSLWVKKTFRTHYFGCPDGSVAELEACGDSTNDGCNLVVLPAFEPLVCGETKCGTAWNNGNRDTDWYEFTLATATKVTWSGSAEFSYVLGFIASPCPSTAFIAYSVGAAGTTVSVTTTLAAGTYYAFAAPQFAETVVCDSLSLYYATLSCSTDIIPPAITNVLSDPGQCSAVSHNVSADVTDDISVGTVNIVWTLDGAAQTDIPMVAGVPPSYSATIPAQGSGAVSFYISASDNASPVNTSVSSTVGYSDDYLAALSFSAGPDQEKPVGSTAFLNATYMQNASCLKITEITLYSTGTGFTSPYPAFMTLGTYDDLVEITNTGTVATDLAGIHLKCEGLRATDYTFPSATVPPGGVVIVAFGTAANDIPNLYFSTGQTSDTWSSGTSNGIWLTTAAGIVIDAMATNTWTFSVASGVSASDWSGTGASALSGNAGTRLTGPDMNNNTNWVTASVSAQNIGTVNAGVPLTCSVSTYDVTWSGGNLPAPVVANPVVTPTFDVPGLYKFTATLSDGLCTVSDDVNVDVPVPAPPVADFSVNSTAQTCGVVSTALFTDLSTNLPTSWAWVITGPGTATYVNATTDASQNPQVQFDAPGLYTVELTATNAAGFDTEIKTDYITVTLAYCTSIPGYTVDEEIFSVTVNGATNAYDCITVAPGPGSILNRYSNFTTLGSLTTMQQGSTIGFTILEDECDGEEYYSNGCAAWIDFNQDGDFTDPDEQVYIESTTTVSPRTITGSFVVPVTALPGVTHMRIIVAEGYFGATLLPCLAYNYGETEDYLVTIEPAVLSKTLNVKVFLEGPFNGTDMETTLNTNSLIPTDQPYAACPAETVDPIPAGVVDWISVELRDAPDPASADPTTTLSGWPKAYFLLADGSIVGLDGASLPDIGNPAVVYNLYVIVRHRNHIGIMSNGALTLTGSTYEYNFTTDIDKAYGGSAGYKELAGSGIFGMVAGDADADGEISVIDFDAWATDFGLISVYLPTDIDTDSEISVLDFDKWATNFGITNPIEGIMQRTIKYSTQIPGLK